MSYQEKPKPQWQPFSPVKIDWKDLVLRPLEQADVVDFCDAVKRSFPHLGEGRATYMLTESYYEKAARPLEDRDGTAILCAYSEGKLVYGIIHELDAQTRSIFLSVAFITPEFRKNPSVVAASFDVFPKIKDWWNRSNAEYAFSYCTTGHAVSQMVTEQAGFRVGGIMPGFALSKRSYGVEIPVESSYYRENVVYYYQYLNDGELLANKRVRLTAEAQRFWDLHQGIKRRNNWLLQSWLAYGRLKAKLLGR